MAYYLQFDGVNDYVNPPVFALGVNDYVEIDFTNYTGKAGLYHYITDGNINFQRLFFGIRTTGTIEIPAGTTVLLDGVGIVNNGSFAAARDGLDHTVRITNTSGTKVFGKLGNRFNNSNEVWPGGIKAVRVSIGGVITVWDGTTAPSSGTTWTATDGSSTLTLVNFPTNNSQWVFYDDGGGVEQNATTNAILNCISNTISSNSNINNQNSTSNSNLDNLSTLFVLNSNNNTQAINTDSNAVSLSNLLNTSSFVNNQLITSNGILNSTYNSISSTVFTHNQLSLSDALVQSLLNTLASTSYINEIGLEQNITSNALLNAFSYIQNSVLFSHVQANSTNSVLLSRSILTANTSATNEFNIIQAANSDASLLAYGGNLNTNGITHVQFSHTDGTVLAKLSVFANTSYKESSENWSEPVDLFFEEEEIIQISLTFDQLGRPLVFYRTEPNVLKLYWYDPVIQQNIVTIIGEGIDPTACFDFPQDTGQPFTDALLFYVRDNQVFMRIQRDRYAIEYPCPATQEGLRINSAGLRVDNRVQVVYSFVEKNYLPQPKAPTVIKEDIPVFKPEFWVVNGPRSSSFACVTEDDNQSIACYFTNRRKGDLVGLIWNTEDLMPHKGLKYETHKNLSDLVVKLEISVYGDMANIDDEFQGLTMTIKSENNPDKFVRIWRYALETTDNRKTTVLLDFSNLKGGFENTPEDLLIDTSNVTQILFGLVTTNYEGVGNTLPMDNNETAKVKIKLIEVNKTIKLNSPIVKPHLFRICTGYDDSYNYTPERLVNNLYKLGYRGRVNHYCGMSHYYEQEWNNTENRFHVKKSGQLLNKECVKWHEVFASELNKKNIGLIFSISYELFSEVCPFEWGQRDWNDNMAVTGYEPPSFLLSPCIEPAMAYLQEVFVEFASILDVFSKDIWMQVGEPWWWFNTNGLKPCFYDFPTRIKFNQETGLFAPEFPTIQSTNLTGTPYDEFKAFLRKELGNSTLGIRDAVKVVYPQAKLAPLVFIPSILDESVGIINDINYPQTEWLYPAWDFMQTEVYDWIIKNELNKAKRAFTLPIDELGYKPEDVHYLAGFVPDNFLGNIILPGYNLENDGPKVWQKMLNNMQTGYAQKIKYQYIWAQPQIDRDSVYIVPQSLNPPIFSIWVNGKFYRASKN